MTAIAAVAALSLYTMPALAEPGNVLQPYAGVTLAADNNLLRLPNSTAALTVIGTDKMSDTSRRGEAGLIIEKQLSQQHISANFNFSRTRFNRFSTLDHDGRDYQARWNWHAGKQVEGNLGTSYTRTLTPFIENHAPALNMRTQKREFFNAAWRFAPNWQMRGGLTHYTLDYDLAAQQFGNRKEVTTEAGLRYLAPSKSSIGIALRHTKGTFPQNFNVGAILANNNYTQNEAKLEADWEYSSKTRMQIFWGEVRRRHDFFPDRDTLGINTRGILTWVPAGSTRLILTGWREIGAVADLTASYTLNQGASLEPSWIITSKLRADVAARYETRSFSGAISGQLDNGRRDIYRDLSIGLSYTVTDKLQFSASVYQDERISSIPLNGFRATGVIISSRLEF